MNTTLRAGQEFGEKSLYDTLELALKYDKLIDAHCDETDDLIHVLLNF